MSDDKDFDPWGAPKPPKKIKPPSPGAPKNPDDKSQGKGSGGKGKTPEQEFEEMFQKFRRNTEMFLSGSGNNKRLITIIIIAVLVLWLAIGSIFFVSVGEKAVILRFGEYDRTVSEGVNLKMPPPFEQVYKRNTENTYLIGIGEGTEENLMVTGDENIVDVEFVVRWNIKNLQDFLFNVEDPDSTAKFAAESAMREIIGDEPMAFALGEGEGRSKISLKVQDLLQKMLDDYKSGIKVVAVDLKKIDVPADVIDAQIDVQNAKTEQQKVKNQAEAYRNDILPRARGDASKMMEDAEGYKQSVVAKAKGDVSRFAAVYDQYKTAKEVTKSRIYLETMVDVMSGMNKIIIDDSSRVVPYLPLNQLNKSELAPKEGKNVKE